MSQDRSPRNILPWVNQHSAETPVNVRDPFHLLAQKIRDRGIPEGERTGLISTAFAAFQETYPLQPLERDGEVIGRYIDSREGERLLVVLPGIMESPYGHIHNFAIPGYRVIIPDYTTFSYPQNATYEETVAAFNRNLDIFLTTIAGDASVTLCGVSLGGLLAQTYLASEHTAHVDQRILIQTAAMGAPVFSEGFLNHAGLITDRFQRLKGRHFRPVFALRRGSGDRVITNDVSLEADERVVRDTIAYAMHNYRRRITDDQLEVIKSLAMFFWKMSVEEAQAIRVATPEMTTLLIDNHLDNIFPPEKSQLRDAYPNAQAIDLNSRRKHRSSWFNVREIAGNIAMFVA